MSEKTIHKSTLVSRFISRVRLIIATIAIVTLSAGFTVYALSTFQSKIVTQTDIPTIQTSDSDKVSRTTTAIVAPPSTTTTHPQPTAVAKPTVSPVPSVPTPTVVTPAPSSDVPTLTATGTGSNSTTSYQSTNWAGYFATGKNITSVSGSWVAPVSTPTSTTVESGDGTWIGIGGVTTSDLIQIGTENSISPSGIVSTSGFYELLPAGAVGLASLTITPGDTMSAAITQTAPTQWTVALTNVTTSRTFSKSVSYSSSLSSAEWIQEDPSYPDGSLVLLDNFAKVPFSNTAVTINGTAFSAAAGNASQITLIGQGGAHGHGGTPSAINGNSFTVQYH